MTINDALKTLIAQRNFNRTPKGRSINEKALDSINACLADTKNYHINAAFCLNCGIILSSVLATKGCINCGNMKLTTEGEIL